MSTAILSLTSLSLEHAAAPSARVMRSRHVVRSTRYHRVSAADARRQIKLTSLVVVTELVVGISAVFILHV